MVRIRVGTSGYSYFWNEGVPTRARAIKRPSGFDFSLSVAFWNFSTSKSFAEYIYQKDPVSGATAAEATEPFTARAYATKRKIHHVACLAILDSLLSPAGYQRNVKFELS